MQKHLDDVKKLYGTKPIIISEWNFKQLSDFDQWQKMLDLARPYIQSRVVTAVYYRYQGIKSEGGWPGVVTQDYRPVEPFYSMYRTWRK